MDRLQILIKIQEIFRKVLDDNFIELTEATTNEDIADWDSLNHIQIVVAIEKNFKISFPSTEMRSWKNIGALVDSIVARI